MVAKTLKNSKKVVSKAQIILPIAVKSAINVDKDILKYNRKIINEDVQWSREKIFNFIIDFLSYSKVVVLINLYINKSNYC